MAAGIRDQEAGGSGRRGRPSEARALIRGSGTGTSGGLGVGSSPRGSRLRDGEALEPHLKGDVGGERSEEARPGEARLLWGRGAVAKRSIENPLTGGGVQSRPRWISAAVRMEQR